MSGAAPRSVEVRVPLRWADMDAYGHVNNIAVVQVLLIVGAHALGVLVTHDIALRTAPNGAAVHLPLLAMMVVFTMGGLLLMFGA